MCQGLLPRDYDISMTHKADSDTLDFWITLGLVVAIGVGLCLVKNAFDNYSKGDLIEAEDEDEDADDEQVNESSNYDTVADRACTKCRRSVNRVAWCIHCGVGSCCTSGFMSRSGEGECIDCYEDTPE
jgi:hypothetical protein